MEKLTIKRGDAAIYVGYRSPGLRALDFNAKMALCNELGMEVIEPQQKELPEVSLAEQYRAAADRAGIRIESCGTMIPVTDPSKGEKVKRDMDHALDIAKALRINYLFILFPHPPEGIPQSETWDLAIERYKMFADAAQAADIRLGIEPEWFVSTVERMDRAINLINHPAVQYVNFDPTNFYLGGSDPLLAISTFAGRIKSGHIKDGVYQTGRKSETPVGEGELDYPAIFKALLDSGATVTMHIEHCREPAQVKAGAEYIRSVIKRLN